MKVVLSENRFEGRGDRSRPVGMKKKSELPKGTKDAAVQDTLGKKIKECLSDKSSREARAGVGLTEARTAASRGKTSSHMPVPERIPERENHTRRKVKRENVTRWLWGQGGCFIYGISGFDKKKRGLIQMYSDQRGAYGGAADWFMRRLEKEQYWRTASWQGFNEKARAGIPAER